MDEETRKEWEKSKRIETERMKAAKALEEDKSSQINSAFLDVETSNLKGYSRDADSLIRSIEKVSGFSLGFAIFGIVLRFFAPMVPDPSGVIAKVASYIGTTMLGISIILAAGSLMGVFLINRKTKFDFKNVAVTAVIALIIVLIYIVLSFRFIVAEFMV